MTTEPVAAAAMEDLRRAELERREQSRRARESGGAAPLRARRRSTGRGTWTDLSSAPVADEPALDPVRLPPRVTHALGRIADELGEGAAVVDDLLLQATSAPDPLHAVAVGAVEFLSRADGLPALGHLIDLAAGGLPVLTETDRARAEAIRSNRLPAPRTDPETVDAWQLHLEATEAQGRAVLSTAAWLRLVEQLPLSVVDDLIDQGALRRNTRPHTWPEQTDRVRYVRARLDPGRLDDTDVDSLDWRDETRRRILAAGGTVEPLDGRHDEWSLRSALLNGEVSALDAIQDGGSEELPSSLADLVLSLQRIRQGGVVNSRLGHDRSLFGLLEDCLPEGRLISGGTPFHYWAGARRLYRLLDDMHWFMACEPSETGRVVRATLQQAAALRNPESHGAAGGADREARAVQAYLSFLHAGPTDRDRLDQGVGLLEDILKRGGKRRGGVEGAQRHRMRTLSELLQGLRLKGKPRDVLNPYLALCVEDGSTEWGQGWRDLRRRVPSEQVEYINGAKDRIRRIETARRLGEEAETLYEVPLNEQFLWVSHDRSELLSPGPLPLARRTEPSTEQEKSWTAVQAAREIIGRCAARLRNDH
ncbi:hypothetical protein [Streptomyces sp. CoT10]|uniref:hypothetical protein n=1 Tax=Streptomyces sp. CoT10 TaxID=2875762 RepID=UPI001CD76A1A|nr:hypothetical protein [Streptomyces sp. CoT10]